MKRKLLILSFLFAPIVCMEPVTEPNLKVSTDADASSDSEIEDTQEAGEQVARATLQTLEQAAARPEIEKMNLEFLVENFEILEGLRKNFYDDEKNNEEKFLKICDEFYSKQDIDGICFAALASTPESEEYLKTEHGKGYANFYKKNFLKTTTHMQLNGLKLSSKAYKQYLERKKNNS